jgi:hypothetical protein
VDEEAQKVLDSFNISMDGYALFPFNQPAIRELSRDGSQQAGQLVYNPRFVIQNVLKKVLKHRQDFETDNFPPEDLSSTSRRLPARVLEEVKSLVNPKEFERWIRFLSYWGGRPSSMEEVAGLSARVPRAFGLDPTRLKLSAAQWSSESIEKAKSPSPSSRGTSKPQGATVEPSPTPERNVAEVQFEEHLERWRNGQTLAQPQALQIRKLLADAVENFINWDWDLFLPLENVSKFFESIYVPNAGGNAGNTQDGESTMFAVCTEDEARDPERNAAISLALMAAFRHRTVYRGSWDYQGADVEALRMDRVRQVAQVRL